jgi:hypothetical protein
MVSKKAPSPEPQKEGLAAAYNAACDLYQRIDDFRAKLLGLLPLASGTGIFLLLEESFFKVPKNALLAIGLFGFAITLGLLLYELRGVQRCIRLINVAANLEKTMYVAGPFRLRVHSFRNLINEPVAAGIIYPSVLAAWIYVAMYFFESDNARWIVPAIVFIGSMATVLWVFYIQYKDDPKYESDFEDLLNGKR